MYIFLVLFISIDFKHTFMHIKLKTILKLTHAHKYKAINFKFCCVYNVNMDRIMPAKTILHKIHYNCYNKCMTSELDVNRHIIILPNLYLYFKEF